MGTLIQESRKVELAEVNALSLNGVSTGRTYQFTDRVDAQCIKLSERCDAVIIDAYSDGNADDVIAFKIWGYSEKGVAKLIYSGNATIGLAVAGDGILFIDTFSADSNNHIKAITIADSAADRVASMMFDAVGYKYLSFEPITFGGNATLVTFNVREYGDR